MVSGGKFFQKRKNKIDEGEKETLEKQGEQNVFQGQEISDEGENVGVPYNPPLESAAEPFPRRRIIFVTASAAALVLVLALSLNFFKAPGLEKADLPSTSYTAAPAAEESEVRPTPTENAAATTEGTVSQSSPASASAAATTIRATPKTTPMTTAAGNTLSPSGIKNVSYTTDPNVLISIDGQPCMAFSLYAAFAAVEEGKKDYEKGISPPMMFTPPDYLGTGDPGHFANYAVDYFIMAQWASHVDYTEGLTEQIGIMGFESDYYERVYANGVSVTLLSWDTDLERVFQHYRRIGKLSVPDSMRLECIRKNNLMFTREFTLFWSGGKPDSAAYAEAESIGREFAEYLCKYGYDQAKYDEIAGRCAPLGTEPVSQFSSMKDIKPGVAQGTFSVEKVGTTINFYMRFDGEAYYKQGFDEVMGVEYNDLYFQRPMFYDTLRREMTERKITINKEKVLEVYQKKTYLHS